MVLPLRSGAPRVVVWLFDIDVEDIAVADAGNRSEYDTWRPAAQCNLTCSRRVERRIGLFGHLCQHSANAASIHEIEIRRLRELMTDQFGRIIESLVTGAVLNFS